MVWFFLCASVCIIIFNGIIFAQQTNIRQQAQKINTIPRPSAAQIIPQFLQHHRVPLTKISRSPLKRKQNNTFFSLENRIELNPEFYDSNDIISISVACHEAGHAAMEYNNKKLMKRMRTSFNIISSIAMSCLLYSIISIIMLVGYGAMLHGLLGIMLAYFLLAICNTHKLFPEWNATRLALNYIQEKHLATTEEFILAKKYLTLCFLTYMTSIIISATVALALLLL